MGAERPGLDRRRQRASTSPLSKPARPLVINGGNFTLKGPIATTPDEDEPDTCECEPPPPPFVTYVKHLLPIRAGYPIWRPSVSDDLPDSYRRMGVSIGDVVAHDGQGGIEYFFNILYSSQDDRNLGRVPENFEQLILPSDIARVLYQHSPGSVVASTASKITWKPLNYCRSHPHPDVPPEVGCGFQLTSGVAEGAVLVLPEGGQREDHRNENAFEDYARRNAPRWFQYINDVRGRRLSESALILVTGVDKTNNWGMAAFNGVDVGPVTMDIVPSPPGAQTKYRFQQSALACAHTGPIGVNRLESPNQCIFLRGIRVVVRQNRWSSKVSVETQCVQEMPFEDAVARSSSSPRNSRSPNSQSPSVSPSSSSTLTLSPSSPDLVVHTERIPLHNPVYDPCTALAHYLLKQVPEASIATMRDSQIFTLLQPDEEYWPDDEELQSSDDLNDTAAPSSLDALQADSEMSSPQTVKQDRHTLIRLGPSTPGPTEDFPHVPFIHTPPEWTEGYANYLNHDMGDVSQEPYSSTHDVHSGFTVQGVAPFSIPGPSISQQYQPIPGMFAAAEPIRPIPNMTFFDANLWSEPKEGHGHQLSLLNIEEEVVDRLPSPAWTEHSASSRLSASEPITGSVASMGVMRTSVRRRKCSANYQCLICDQAYTTKNGLRNHMNSHRLHANTALDLL
ncbi:hypothetical protein VNI00_005984 [Paramarasmius palmivorus]|uniref:C2H2-type domain-containing protein n=1 Tax=Paramarasmius palmivorus TaxID=297713 RepID=A0AAW0DD49_9AGAR